VPVVDMLVHPMRLCGEVLDSPPEGFRAEETRTAAPARLRPNGSA